MLRSMCVMLVSAVFIFGAARLSFAQMDHSAHEQGAEVSGVDNVPGEAVDAGNKICPVSGEKIDEKMKATYEYQGKIYNFCCAGCSGKFKEDPDKYIEIVNEELN
ncbi:MAG: hypothetical protein COV71_03175 [Candidatus Omnitrophica bacterium CG11_big_fil_rev_8_21_14_0_20_41_12]|nr:MAG: hypothetical protein COV71_03175 [Candidatus Omnitrophica bacterium CG11_big_fil_rev_8_21_14_0_20_41_12]